ncbi:hypothetical protein [Burkholderia multivorans]|uniref:hypothetical protein n=1 Tax=Burkholderia multivorans TaxID=87883 RepID=UPI0011B26BDF|nr:hypothetical protein [Burkholderia multivorans]
MDDNKTVVPYDKNTKEFIGADEAIHYIKTGQMEAYEIFAPKHPWSRPEFVSSSTYPEGGFGDFSGNENTDPIPYLNLRDLNKFLDAGIKFDHHVFVKNAIDIAYDAPAISKIIFNNGAKECVTEKDKVQLEKLARKTGASCYQELLSIVDEELKNRSEPQPHSFREKISGLRDKFLGNKNSNDINLRM